MNGAFDDQQARKRLEPQGIQVTPVAQYIDRLIVFAQQADWDHRPMPRNVCSD